MGRAAGMWAEFLFHAGEVDEALQQNEMSCRLAEEVAAADPANAEYQRDLAVALTAAVSCCKRARTRRPASGSRSVARFASDLPNCRKANEKRRRELMLVLAHTDESFRSGTAGS